MTDLRAAHIHRGQAQHIWAKLAEQLEILMLLQRELKRLPQLDLSEQARIDRVTDAIQHLEHAMQAVRAASRD